MNQDVRSTD